MKYDQSKCNKTQGSLSGAVLSAGPRKSSPKPVKETGKFHGGGRDNVANPKYSNYTDTSFSKHHKE